MPGPVAQLSPLDRVAYLFTMRREAHPLSHAWARYFEGCPEGSYAVFSHVDPAFAASSSLAISPFNGSRIPSSIKVDRMGFSMVQARILLLHHALAQGGHNWFAFLSDACGPVTTCDKAHAFLRARSGASFVPALTVQEHGVQQVGTAKAAEFMRRRLRGLSTFSAATYRTAGIGGGWTVLERRAARHVVRASRRLEADFGGVNHTGLKRFEVAMECPDEWVWSTLLHSEGLPMHGYHVTCMSFRSVNAGGHADLFNATAVRDVVARARRRDCLFARKFTPAKVRGDL